MNQQKGGSGLAEESLRPESVGVAVRAAGSSAPLPLAEGAPVVAVAVEVVVAAAAEDLAADVAAAFPS